MSKKANEKIVSGLAWSYAERISAQFVSFCVSLVLARLIAPEAYGAIAIVIIFINIGNTFVTGGVSNALIQKKDADLLDFSSVFYFSVFLGLVTYALIFVTAPIVATFFNIPQLNSVLKIMGLRFPLAAINSVQQAYISKKMEFKKFFFSTIAGTVVSAIIGIYMAYAGWGIWALVAQYLINSTVDTIIVSIVSGWHPTLEYSWERMRELLPYGWKILTTSMLITIYVEIRDIVIGKIYTADELAYCNKGKQFPMLITTNINTALTKVLFPVMAESQNEMLTIKSLTRKSIKIGNFLLAPLLFGMLACAPQMVEVLLTNRWQGAVPFIKIMCIVYFLQPMQIVSVQVMKALGKGDIYLRLEIYKKIIGIVVLIVTIMVGKSVLWIMLGALISEVISALINFPFNKKYLDYSIKEQIWDIVPSLLLSFPMVIVVIGIGYLELNPILKFILQIFSGGLVYLTIAKTTNAKELDYILNTIKNVKGRKK